MGQPFPQGRTFEGLHATLTLRRERPGLVVLELAGNDVGELHDAPFQLLSKYLEADGSIELFIDARRVRTASIEVSNDWAVFLRNHRSQLIHISMLTATRFIQLTADFVRRFANLEQMRIYTAPDAFDAALAEARHA